MEVKIGIQSVPRELIIETDETQAEIETHLERALAAYLQPANPDQEPHASSTAIFKVTTTKGGRVLIPADKIAFIEFSTDQARRVGFGNIV